MLLALTLACCALLPVQEHPAAPSAVVEVVAGGQAGPGLAFRRDLGRGVVIDGGGWIVASTLLLPEHLPELFARWDDGVERPAHLVHVDARAGLALLKVAVDAPLTTAPLRSTRTLELGATVLVLRRERAAVPAVVCRIALATTTADPPLDIEALAPLDGGVPVLDVSGRLLGLARPTAEGARVVPLPGLEHLLAALPQRAETVRRRLGLRSVDHPRMAGVWISGVEGPALFAQLRKGDVVDGVDELAVDGLADLVEAIECRPSGTTITLRGFRDGCGFRTRVVLGGR